MKLLEIIDNPNLSWDNSFEKNQQKYVITLNKSTIDLLFKNRDHLETRNLEYFDFLNNEILEFKKKLKDEHGFFIIEGKNFLGFTKNELRSIYAIISEILGELYIQNINKEKFVLIKDEGKSMKSGGRYHQTKEGGSYHTDSPQWEDVPDFVGLLCINPAKNGGINKFLSAYSIHNEILRKNPIYLDELYKNFYFDKRGEYEKNESPTIFQPIFNFENGELYFRYLRNYIDDGYKLENKVLTKSQIDSLDLLDEISQNEQLTINYEMKSGDMIFFNNHRILHGRTSFEDFDDNDLKRTLVRVWIKDNHI